MNYVSRPSQGSARHRRIGQKALRSDRISRALYGSVPSKSASKFAWSAFSFKPKQLAYTGAALVVLLALGFAGSQVYISRTAAAKKVEIARQQKISLEKSAAADACRRKKVEQKADLIGKITYDELYDNGECDK